MAPPGSNPLVLAQQSLESGDAATAARHLRRVLTRRPMDAAANQLMCVALARSGDVAGAITHARRAVMAEPTNADLLHNLGKLLLDAGQARRDLAEEGVMHLAKSLSLDPGRTRTRLHLAVGHLSLGRPTEALSVASVGSQDGDLCLAAADASAALGDMSGALRTTEAALKTWPAHTGLLQRRASLLCYLPGYSADAVRTAHRHWAQRLEQDTPAAADVQAPPIEPAGRAARIVLLSHDLVRHSVACFVQPIVRWLDRSRFTVVCINTRPIEDEVSARLREHADDWRHWPGLSPAELAGRLGSLRPDVIIELNGLTEGHSLAALAMRPAFRQLSYLGYPASTGLGAIRARISDGMIDPAPVQDEPVATMEGCFCCYAPPAELPEVSARTLAGPPTLGAFNQIFKLTDETLAAWARILHAVPGAVLRIKSRGLEQEFARDALTRRAGAAGIDGRRLTLEGWRSGDHLDAYNEVDVSLDCWPYNGVTTTCEALLMGVPVVSLAGDAGAPPAARTGASLLEAAGFEDSITNDVDAYVQRAVRLLTDRAALAAERPARRALFLASSLCDGPGYAARLGRLLESVLRS